MSPPGSDLLSSILSGGLQPKTSPFPGSMIPMRTRAPEGNPSGEATERVPSASAGKALPTAPARDRFFDHMLVILSAMRAMTGQINRAQAADSFGVEVRPSSEEFCTLMVGPIGSCTLVIEKSYP